jgi:signal transduction histidine kinase
LEVRTVRRRWQNAADAPRVTDDQLPALTRKLARLQQLECRFSETLQREKLAALGELAYGASHEINNPLANISTRAQTMLREESDPERRRKLAIINTQAFRAHEMIADMMLFARPPKPHRERIDVVSVVEKVIEELADEAAEQGTQLEHSGRGEQLFLSADATQLAVALRAVCVNALEALGAGGRVDLSLDEVTDVAGDPRHWVRITICDSGPGIPAEIRRHIFDPFFSGREAGRGMGLGLAKCWRVITLHGGRMEVASEPGQGATFTIYMPKEKAPEADRERASKVG